MSTRAELGAWRRLVGLACALATGVVVAAPLLLGPATTAFMRAVGVEPEHVCMCGMKPGTCGCPECERLEEERREELPSHATLKSTCGEGETAPVFAPLPPAVVSAMVARLASPRASTRDLAGERRPETRPAARPPIPPPRARG